MADVNVTEKVRAEAIRRYPSGPDHFVPHDLATRRSDFYNGWLAALATLADPEVLDEIAEVLRQTFADSTCGGHLDLAGDVADWMPEATAVVEWLRGRAL